ncbi:MAG: DUF389 domain-containing protein [Bacteroidales bacterium]|nr:DUF389 domain-containing protein [Bacteroidales bacterium]
MEERKSIRSEFRKYFSMRGFLTDKSDVVSRINDGITFRGPYLWVLVFAILLASLGLNVNSTAVIIGAMLISPLMGPIIGMGFSVGTNDFELLKTSLKNYAVATIISLVTATVYFALTPYHGAQSELLARTSPTLYDVLIALLGGAAGIVAIASKDKGNILPGVAIATALMPPLCTAGFGIASLNLKYFLGAFFLYFINTVFIALATYLGVRAMKFRPVATPNDGSFRRVRGYLIAIVVATMVPAAILTVNIIRESFFASDLQHFIKNEMSYGGSQIISQNIDKDEKILTLAAVGREIPDTKIAEAKEKMPLYGLGDYTLNIIQGNLTDSILSLKGSISSFNTTKDELNATITHQSAEIAGLQDRIAQFTRYEKVAKQMIDELQTLYPQVLSLSLSPTTETGKDTNDVDIYVTAQLVLKDQTYIPVDEISRLTEFLKKRVDADSLVLILR